MKMELDQSVVRTFEYQSLSKLYPHITESIRLKRKIERLSNEVKSEKNKSLEFKIKREITITKTKLRKNNLLKRLHGENKQEAIFHRKFKRNRSKIRFSLLMNKFGMILGRPVKTFKMKIGKAIHKKLPPSLFNLKELDVAEKGLLLREWLQEKHDALR